jgi:two-component system CheB/CheR fusion protein
MVNVSPAIKAGPEFIVGVGASAGGLDALGRFFGAVPAQNGLAFVVVQHLSPDHKSFMVELLSRKSHMPVVQAEDGQTLRPAHVYLLPPRKLLKVFQGKVLLTDTAPERGLQLPIDVFFRSLADDQKGRAIGVILSGTGSDGTLGVRAIKDEGGMVMVQSEASAEFDGMPRSAIGTGLADFIAAPEELPGLLAQYVKHPLAVRDGALVREETAPESAMRLIFAILRERTGVDFSFYKATTIDRRIERRMSVQQIDSLQSYARFLETSPQETEVLFNNLLICVTRFFRDREMWELLEKDLLEKLLEALGPQETFRAWMPGCSTGEEAYSMAMVLSEVMERMGRRCEVKIFATDVSKESLDAASIGFYSESMVADIPPERLARHFVRRPDGFQIAQTLRKSVVFARHDLLKDPPFTRMDLVCCRNLLIYFQPLLQAKVLQAFRNALKPDAVLVLGSSETPGELADRFTTVNARHRIYRLKAGARGLELPFPIGPGRTVESLHATASRLHRPPEIRTSLDFILREIIREFAPACFVVDENRELLHLFGRAGEYLQHPDGSTTNNILRLTTHNLGPALGPALHKAARDNAEFVYDNVRFTHNGVGRVARLKVRPLATPGQSTQLFLVFVEEVRVQPEVQPGQDFQTDQAVSQRIRELEQELAHARENLQATVEELETSNEELQASNEELVASNEELQSTNEELQSVNEELHTVNAEHHGRIEELIALSNDLSNLFTVANIGAALVDEDLRLRKMASAMFPLTGLTPSDVGAPIEVLARQLDAPAVLAMAARVRDSGVTEELEIMTGRGKVLLVRATPFLTETGQSSGLVLTLVDITARSRSEARVVASEGLLRGVLNSLPAHIAVVDAGGVITQVNEAWDRFARQNGAPKGSALGVGANYFDICRAASGPFGDEARAVLEGMEAVLAGRLPCYELEYPCHSPEGHRWFLLHVSRISLPTPGLVVSHSRLMERKGTP